ncbi:MAG TPA: hypothetical protein VK730_06905 [Solirubrobacteraceae bacterium]|nr:hypothetical protein [Solirubrobacteraceae bacterium]
MLAQIEMYSVNTISVAPTNGVEQSEDTLKPLQVRDIPDRALLATRPIGYVYDAFSRLLNHSM